jgi:hypothetical protein
MDVDRLCDKSGLKYMVGPGLSRSVGRMATSLVLWAKQRGYSNTKSECWKEFSLSGAPSETWSQIR